VPFAAFEHHGRPLIERYTVTAAFAWAPDQAGAAPFGAGLVVGAAKGGDGVAALPQASIEGDFVAEWLSGRCIPTLRLDNQQATHAAVVAQLPASTHVHVASHGVFHADRPDRSGLLIGGTGGNEVLSVRDIAALDLSNLQLVVLSACWSADNFVLPGRYVISVPYALWRAGARSVLAALWEIDDRVAMAFMRRFYTLLATGSARDALRLTQLECVQNRLPGCCLTDTSDPVCWSGFQLYGDGRISG
jgi:CHAT domain-containing protein